MSKSPFKWHGKSAQEGVLTVRQGAFSRDNQEVFITLKPKPKMAWAFVHPSKQYASAINCKNHQKRAILAQIFIIAARKD